MELRNEWKAFMEDDHGVGVIELVLVLVEIFTGKKDVFNVFCNPILTDSISVYTSESYQCILC